MSKLLIRGHKFWINEVPDLFKYDDKGISYSSYYEDDIENFLKQDLNTEVLVNYMSAYDFEVIFANPKYNLLFEIKYHEYVIDN